VRCRLVKDNPGYFLAPHNDSTDTLFAFLLPIKKSQQPTSSFRKIRVQSLLKSVYPRKSDAIAFFTTRYQCESMTEISDQFQRNSALTIHYCRKRNLLITVSDSVENYNITVWRCRDLTVLEDEVLIIPNSTNKIFDSHLLTPAKLLGAHGVLPTIEERINLLADVLCLEIDDNQREIGFKQNKKEVMFSVNL